MSDIDQNIFDDDAYMRANLDVAEAVRDGKFSSGYDHYINAGFRDGRPLGGLPEQPRNVMLSLSIPGLLERQPPRAIACRVEDFAVSPGGVLITGWIDDKSSPIDSIRIVSATWRLVIDGDSLIRQQRTDVETLCGDDVAYAYGYIGFLAAGDAMPAAGPCTIEMWRRDGTVQALARMPVQVNDARMRDMALHRMGNAVFAGHRATALTRGLAQGAGAALVRLNRGLTAQLVRAPYVERFGNRRAAPSASIVICLFGKAEFLFLQTCLHAGLPSMENVSFVIVSNSPELAETLLKTARCCSLVHDVDITLVILPGNAGFGAANNAAVKVAASQRLIFINPDVLPKDPLWAQKHAGIVASLPPDRNRLFGVPLYYDDGALMHGGMYFDIDTGLSLHDGMAQPARLVRVEHYGKGAPSGAGGFLHARPLPAVTGAFISCDRAWFETLGGFTEDYVFGHYEDADLCLKSWVHGVPPWLHDIGMWHLEGKGGTRLPIHEAGGMVNRWLFSENWLPFIEDGLLGAAPAKLRHIEEMASQPETVRPKRMRAVR